MVKELNDLSVSLSDKELKALTKEMQYAYSRMYFPHTWQSVIELFRWLVNLRRELKRVKASKGRALKRLNELQKELTATKKMLEVERTRRLVNFNPGGMDG